MASIIPAGLAVALFFPGIALGIERHVALTGSDTNNGAPGTPFRHLQHCADVSSTGDVCVLAAGIYDTDADAVTLSTQNLKGLTIRGPEAEEQAVLDGSIAVKLQWHQTNTSGSACVWESDPLPQGIATPSQLFLDTGSSAMLMPLTPARFPNARLADDSIFDAHSPNGSMLVSAKTSSLGTIVDDGTHIPSLADSGLDVTNMVAVVPLGTMGIQLQGVRVTKHGKGSNQFSYAVPEGAKPSGHPNIPYFFEGDCELLDAEHEWCVVSSTNTLHARRLRAWLPNCANPNNVQLRMKARQVMVNTSRCGLTLQNLTIRAATFTAFRADVLLDGVSLHFPTSSGRAAGNVGQSSVTMVSNTPGVGSFSMYNSRMEWADSVCPLDTLGDKTRIVNSEFLRSGYAGGSCAVVGDAGQADVLIEHNTMHLFNSFTAIVPGPRATVAFNDIGGQGAASDGALIHVHINSQNGVFIYRNWLHDSQVKGARFDRVNQPGAPWGHNGTIVQNVAWATAGIMVKGDNHTVRNNTAFDTVDGGLALSVMEYDPTIHWSTRGENKNTFFFDNAADSYFNVSGVLAGHNSGNYAGSIAAQLMNPLGRDFRPRIGTALAKSGAGAYQLTDKWVAGRLHSRFPVPLPNQHK